MSKSGFTRKIQDISLLKDAVEKDSFLYKIKDSLLKQGNALLAFRDEEVTIYYHGNQLCNLKSKSKAMPAYAPTVYNRYLPVLRSKTLRKQLAKKNVSEETWRKEANIAGSSFTDIFEEILDHIEKDSSPESRQVSRFYRFSPMNLDEDHEIVLLDIEAAFACSNEKTDRIDLVFYHTTEQRLMFVEVKRLSDSRLYGKDNQQAEVIDQLNRYRDRLKDEDEKANINTQYNRVIAYYNAFSGKNLPLIQDAEPILGLLLVEFTLADKGPEGDVQKVRNMMTGAGFKIYAIGDTSNMTKDSTVQAIYKALK